MKQMIKSLDILFLFNFFHIIMYFFAFLSLSFSELPLYLYCSFVIFNNAFLLQSIFHLLLEILLNYSLFNYVDFQNLSVVQCNLTQNSYLQQFFFDQFDFTCLMYYSSRYKVYVFICNKNKS